MNPRRDPTARFSDRVTDYVRSRPRYPAEVVDLLRHAGWLTTGATVADLGCGTGKLALPLLRAGYRVIGVEPNEPMRRASLDQLAAFEQFECVDGRAEATGLPDVSVDLACAGQAFHWFEPRATARELRRILRPRAGVALIWNERVDDGDGPMAAYEALMREHGTDYVEVRGGRVDEADLGVFFDADGYSRHRLAHVQRLDVEGLLGRVFSCSYMPAAGERGHDAARRVTLELFERHATAGVIELRYDATVYLGRPSGGCDGES